MRLVLECQFLRLRCIEVLLGRYWGDNANSQNMPKLTQFEELGCWKAARKLTVAVYRIPGKMEKDYGLKDQLRRASVSIMNNIAEGFGRFSDRERIRYLEIAQSSANEVKSMIYLMRELQYIDEARNNRLHEMAALCQKQTWGLIKYLKSTQSKSTN